MHEDQSGYININDLTNLLNPNKDQTKNDEIKLALNEVDQNHDGKIDREEFKHTMEK